MERLVTRDDIEKYPELISMGVSINQNFDFSYLEQQQQQSSSNQLAPDAPNNVHEHQYKAPVAQPPKAKEAKKEVKVAPVKKAAKKVEPTKKEAPIKKVAQQNQSKEVPAKKVAKVVLVKKVAAPKKASKKGK